MFAQDTTPQNLDNIQSNRRTFRFQEAVFSPFKEWLGLGALRRIYNEIREGAHDAQGFVDLALTHLDVELQCRASERARIPRSGAFVVVANHPFGMLEGLLVGKLLLEQRRDVLILANYMLARIPELHPLCIFVDPWARPSSRAHNASALKRALRHLRGGGLLAVFPAGEVAHRTFGDRGELHDPPWQRSIGGLIQRAGAPVLPLHICGENSLGFQLVSMVHPTLRTALLPRELLNKRGKRVEIRVGQPIATRKLGTMSAEAFTTYLQERSEILQHRPMPTATPEDAAAPKTAPLASEIPAPTIADELNGLDGTRCLLSHGQRRVFMAPAVEIPNTLLELGRLRQLAFRAVGEGTDEPRDLDRFDTLYSHLLVWDDADQAIVGAYRVGRVDKLLAAEGRSALYTHTLFDIGEGFFAQIGDGALELGRSFIQPRYQRDATGLLLLWKGIGAFIASHPQYRYLFGPCSVSHDYSPMSRHLMLRYLHREHGAPELARHIAPRVPLRRQKRVDAALPRYDRWMTSLAEVSSWVTHLEIDEKRVPVLMRQYVAMGGRILGFNVDPAFKSVVDCFVLVDLLDAPPRALAMFMGPKAAQAYQDQLRKAHVGRVA